MGGMLHLDTRLQKPLGGFLHVRRAGSELDFEANLDCHEGQTFRCPWKIVDQVMY